MADREDAVGNEVRASGRWNALQTRRNGFATEVMSGSRTRQYLESISIMRSEGKGLRASAEALVVVPICKAPDRPFRRRITIGRTRQCDITIPDRTHVEVPRLHRARGNRLLLRPGRRRVAQWYEAE